MKKTSFYLMLMVLGALCHGNAKAQRCTVSVTNPSAYERQEVVSLDGKALKKIQKRLQGTTPDKWLVQDGQGQDVATQYTHDGELLIDACVARNATNKYTICIGKGAEKKPAVFLKMYPNRVDDIAWENDLIAFRTYGPALERSGEKAYGLDIWIKNIPDLVVDERYDRELNPKHKAEIEALKKTDPEAAKKLADSYSYHIDHGNGMDCYKVGPTLGCGAPAIMSKDGDIIYPKCYTDYEFLDKGPLRITFTASYAEREIAGLGKVKETRKIQLDKGSQLNKVTVKYEGMKDGWDVGAGIIVHAANTVDYQLNKEAGYISYKDPTEDATNGNGWIFNGIVFPEKVKKMEEKRFSKEESKERKGDFGHLMGTVGYKGKTGFTYYTGAAWSKYNIHTMREWDCYLQQFCGRLKQPMRVKVD